MSRGEEERLMTLAELAVYLHMGQKTVLKLAVDRKLPGKLIEKEWRFRRASIDQWLGAQLEDTEANFEAVTDGARVPLGDVLLEAAIVHDMQAREPLGAIEELAARAWSLKFLKDKPWFVGALVEREALSSTAMEGGVAFLHTRSRDTERVNRPFIIVGRTYEGVAFGAPDGKPTYLFFLLGLKYDRLHLPILGRLARIIAHNPQVVARLRASTSPSKIRGTLLQLDAEALEGVQRPIIETPVRRAGLDKHARLRAIMRVNAQRKFDAKKAAIQLKSKKKPAVAGAPQRSKPPAKPKKA